ncbi:MAG: hypothetical protein E7315_01710 [Clostridiales bacterium]|nr:hypothetical protein [Clostridiales bacterium]
MNNKKTWMKLDNAAKIYPAVMTRSWTALFRVSATLKEDIDPQILQIAAEDAVKRFPAFAKKLKKGLFWYYLEHIDEPISIQKDVGNPCMRMNLRENNGYMLRIRYYGKRIAVEFFHVLTDGTGGMTFLKTLVARYIMLKYSVQMEYTHGVLCCDEEPCEGESEDSFLRYARDNSRSRKEGSSYNIPGTNENNFMNIVTGMAESKRVLEEAKRYNATLTEYLTSELILAVDSIQRESVANRKKFKPIKICVPINLRRFYNTKTVRNFASYTNPGIEPKYGQYTLDETVKIVKGHFGMEMDEKLLNAKFSTNVQSENNRLLSLAPLFIKRWALKFVYSFKGDRQTSTVLSNLGVITLPPCMDEYVERVDFMLGPLKRNRVTCACVSYKGVLYINFTRTIKEAYVERNFFTSLVKKGIHIKVESNQRW